MATTQQVKALQLRGAAMNQIYGLGKAPAKTAAKVVAKTAPLSVRQQAIQQVNAVNNASMATANQGAAKALVAARMQAQQALGFQKALADMNQGDAGRIYDAYGNAADKVSAYGNLALASTGDSSRSAAEQAQNYLASVGPDVGAETRPDIAGALRALGATAVGDEAGALKAQGAFAQERQQSVRDAQLMRLADIGANAMYQGTQTANQLRSDEIARATGSRAADVNAAITALKGEKYKANEEGRAARADTRAGVLATNTERRARADEGRAVTQEQRDKDDQRMKDLAFDIELQQKQVDLAATKLANATGVIAKKKAQFELDNAQKVLDASLKQQAAETASTKATTAATKATTKAGGKGGITAYEHSQAVKQAHDAAQRFYSPPAPTKLGEEKKLRANYQDALPRLMGKFGLTKAEAVDVLNVYYKEPGKDGRPAFDFRERAQLQALGFTGSQIAQAMDAYSKAVRGQKFNPAGKSLYEKMLDRLGSPTQTTSPLATTRPSGSPVGVAGPMG